MKRREQGDCYFLFAIQRLSQAAHRQCFREAVAFARHALADPQLQEAYAETGAKKGKRAFEMAVSDFLQSGKE